MSTNSAFSAIHLKAGVLDALGARQYAFTPLVQGEYRFRLDDHGNVTRIVQSLDLDQDGIPDVATIDRRDYDAAGNRVLRIQGTDADANGAIDHVEKIQTYQYDADEHLVRERATRYHDDGSFDELRATRYEYDGTGHLVQQASYNAPVGFADSLQIDSYEYDADGKLIREVYRYKYGQYNGYFSSWGVTLHEYDADGNLTRSVTHPKDFNPMYHVSTIERYVYDAAGNSIYYSRLDDNSPVSGANDFRHSIRSVHDSNGNVTLQIGTFDHDADGMVDDRYVDRYEYDAAGNVIREVYMDDSNADGTVDYRDAIRYEYDATGNLTREAYFVDGDADGNFEYSEVTRYEYDASGNLTFRVDSTVSDGALEERTAFRFIYDSAGNLTRAVVNRDVDGDGTYDMRVVATFTGDARTEQVFNSLHVDTYEELAEQAENILQDLQDVIAASDVLIP